MRRLGVLLVLALLVGCGGDDDEPTVAGVGSTTSSAIAPAPGDGAGPSGSPDAPTPQPQPQQPPATVLDSGEPVAPEPPSPAQEDDAGGSAGTFAPAILGGGGEILVEVIAEPGVQARGSTLAHVSDTLEEVSGKSATPVLAGTPAPSDASWTAEELRAVADAAGTPQSDGRVVLHLIFVHGRWHESDTVLGVAVRGDTAALFVDAVDEAASPLVGSAAIEEAAALHEVGHLLGLVDLHLSTGRADPEHPGHSTNRESVMYWAVESTLITDVLAGGPPREFDADDLADLRTIRSRAG